MIGLPHYTEASPKFLSKKETKKLLHLAEALLGVSQTELGGQSGQFIIEANRYLSEMPRFFSRELHLLFVLINSRAMAGLMIHRLKPFTSMTLNQKEKYLSKWLYSRIPLLRTAFVTLKALCGWAYYSNEAMVLKEIPDYPGRTLDRETTTPTLLKSSTSWVPIAPRNDPKFIVRDH